MTALATLLLLLAPQSDAVRCTLSVEPTDARIGQPIACTLVVEHPAGTRARLDESALLPDDSWILLEDPSVLPESTAGGARTTARWTVASLDPGERAYPAPPTMVEVGGVPTNCAEQAATIAVAGELSEGEDAPRPPARPPLPAGDEEQVYVSPWWLLAPPAALVALYLAVRLARRRPAPVPLEAGAAPRARLEALDPSVAPAAYCAELRDALRAGVDAADGADRRGLTDEEWLAATAAEDALRERLAAVLTTCERARFGGERPTPWALDELRGEALALLPTLAAEREEVAA